MKIKDKIRSLLGRRPATDEELAARKEAEALREQILLDHARNAADTAQVDRFGGL
jgi:hypothetical protein